MLTIKTCSSSKGRSGGKKTYQIVPKSTPIDTHQTKIEKKMGGGGGWNSLYDAAARELVSGGSNLFSFQVSLTVYTLFSCIKGILQSCGYDGLSGRSSSPTDSGVSH